MTTPSVPRAERHAAFLAAVGAGDWDLARTIGHAFLADPDASIDRARLHRALGIVARRADEPHTAHAHLEQAVALGADDPETLAHLGGLVRELDSEHGAERGLALLSRAVTVADPHGDRRPWHHLALARALTEDTLDTEAALVHFVSAARDPACRPEALAGMTALRLRLGDLAGALAAAAELASDPSAPLHAIVHALAALADVPAAAQPFWDLHARATLACDAPNLDLALFAAHRHLVDGFAERAAAAAREALHDFPEAPRARWALAEAQLHVTLGASVRDAGDAAATLETIAPSLADAPAELRRFFAATALALNAPLVAAPILGALHASHPDDARTALLEAEVLAAQGNLAAASDALARARAHDPHLDRMGANLEDNGARLLATVGLAGPDAPSYVKHIHQTPVALEIELGASDPCLVLGLHPLGPAATERAAAIEAVVTALAAHRPADLAFPVVRVRIGHALVLTRPAGTRFDPGTVFTTHHARGLGSALASLRATFAALPAPTSALCAGPPLSALVTREGLDATLARAAAPAFAKARITALHAPFSAVAAHVPVSLVHGEFGPHALLWEAARPTALVALGALTTDLVVHDAASAALALLPDPTARALLPTFLEAAQLGPLTDLAPIFPFLVFARALGALAARTTSPARVWSLFVRDLDRLFIWLSHLPPSER